MHSYIARDSAAYASAIVRQLIQSAARLAEFPTRGRVVPEWGDETVREVFVHRFRSIYRMHDGRIEIIAVIHGARLLPDELRLRN